MIWLILSTSKTGLQAAATVLHKLGIRCIIDRLTAAGNLQANLINRGDAIEALKITRESLVCALKTERILRENQQFIGRRYELFANIESNFAALMAVDVSARATEYGRLLNEALEIGMSVHKEVRKLPNGK